MHRRPSFTWAVGRVQETTLSSPSERGQHHLDLTGPVFMTALPLSCNGLTIVSHSRLTGSARQTATENDTLGRAGGKHQDTPAPAALVASRTPSRCSHR